MVCLFGHDVPWLAIIKLIGLHFLVRRDFAGAKLSFFALWNLSASSAAIPARGKR
jgi:hypothetical protein